METADSSRNIWRFGIFEVDTRAAELRRNGTPVKTRDQSFRILVHLLEHAGEIVSREELRRVLWPADTFVDFEHSLNTAVMKLREALGDSADTPLYIETVPRRGYRFIAPVSQSSDGSAMPAAIIEAPAPTTTVAPANEALPAAVSGPARSIQPAALIALLCLVAAVSLAFLWTRHSPSRSTSPEPAIGRIVPVTTAAGSALTPVFSPDGREIAFAWDGTQPGRYDVYVQLLGAEKPLRLTYGKTGLIGSPGWSPDGRQIAFSRCDGKNDGVFVVPALGGQERKLTSVGCYYLLPGSVIWTNDGSGILMVDRCSADGPFGIVLFSLATGQKRCVTNAGAAEDSDVGVGFALSPDGATIVYATLHPSRSIYTVPISGGTPRQLVPDPLLGCSTFTEYGCSNLMWTPDGRSIVFVSYRTSLPSVWHVSASGGVAERETVYPSVGSFSRDGRGLVYSDSSGEPPLSIWRASLSSPGGPFVNSKKVVSSQYPDMDAQPSPDGSRIVWESVRTASEELWTSDASGAAPVQLTHLEGDAGTARWSPDGRWIAFDFYLKHSPQIYVIDSEGRNLRSITSGDADNVVPSWSRDGNFIYFASRRSGSWQVWRHSLATGAESQLTTHGGFDPFESFDGHTVYFSRFDQAGIWSVPVTGGPESLIIADRPQVGYWGYWAMVPDGIYFLDTDAEPGPTIEFYRFATRRTTLVFTLQQQPVRLEPSLSATADGKSIFYTQYERQSAIKLIEFAH